MSGGMTKALAGRLNVTFLFCWGSVLFLFQLGDIDMVIGGVL